MNEETMVFEEVTNGAEEVIEVLANPEIEGNSGLIGKLVIGAVVVGAGIAAIMHKTRDKREELMIRKLEKKGYMVHKQEPEAVKDESVETEEHVDEQ